MKSLEEAHTIFQRLHTLAVSENQDRNIQQAEETCVGRKSIFLKAKYLCEICRHIMNINRNQLKQIDPEASTMSDSFSPNWHHKKRRTILLKDLQKRAKNIILRNPTTHSFLARIASGCQFDLHHTTICKTYRCKMNHRPPSIQLSKTEEIQAHNQQNMKHYSIISALKINYCAFFCRVFLEIFASFFFGLTLPTKCGRLCLFLCSSASLVLEPVPQFNGSPSSTSPILIFTGFSTCVWFGRESCVYQKNRHSPLPIPSKASFWRIQKSFWCAHDDLLPYERIGSFRNNVVASSLYSSRLWISFAHSAMAYFHLRSYPLFGTIYCQFEFHTSSNK